MVTILIVDDSPTEAEVVRDMLEKVGYEVIWADHADQGIRMAEQMQPSLILMDVVMPGMNGFQATRKLTRNPKTKDIPVVMLTTKDQVSDREWGLKNGARAYFVKPPEKESLLNQIKLLI